MEDAKELSESCYESLDDEDQLTAEDLLCPDSYFAQGLRNLNLDADFGETILASAKTGGDDALDRAADITLALAKTDRSSDDNEKAQRQRLAAESYEARVAGRPKGTSSIYNCGKRHFVVCDQTRAHSNLLAVERVCTSAGCPSILQKR